MAKAEFVPAIGEQFNSVWRRGLKYKGKDGKEYDMKFFTDQSHFQLNIGLQSCFYGICGTSKDQVSNDLNKNPIKVDRDYSKGHFRNLIGWPKNKTLITDSAGFQIASFKIRGEQCKINPMDSLRWQEANADIAMNLDIPPTLGKVAEYDYFKEALKQSVENFKFFEANRRNFDMKLYNVLHGENIKLMDEWYNAVKGFTSFDGWAVGMKPPFDPMIQAMGFMYLWDKGEVQKDSCYGIHFFGTSGKHVVPTIVYIANKLQNKRITYDSSSYNIGSIYRTYYMPFDIGPHLSFGEKFKRINPHLKELPCQCPVCNSIVDIEDLNKTDIYAGTLISLHNMYQYQYYNEMLNKLVGDKELFLEYLRNINISKKTLKSIEFIDYAFEKGIYNAVDKYKHYLIPQNVEKTRQVDIFDF